MLVSVMLISKDFIIVGKHSLKKATLTLTVCDIRSDKVDKNGKSNGLNICGLNDFVHSFSEQ